jgi:predicted DNA-binding transcriptional regulator AlpA
MPTTLSAAPHDDAALLADVQTVARLCSFSPRHAFRMAAQGRMPKPAKIGSLVRWRLRTGDPSTGLLDWLDAGCPNCRQAAERAE